MSTFFKITLVFIIFAAFVYTIHCRNAKILMKKFKFWGKVVDNRPDEPVTIPQRIKELIYPASATMEADGYSLIKTKDMTVAVESYNMMTDDTSYILQITKYSELKDMKIMYVDKKKIKRKVNRFLTRVKMVVFIPCMFFDQTVLSDRMLNYFLRNNKHLWVVNQRGTKFSKKPDYFNDKNTNESRNEYNERKHGIMASVRDIAQAVEFIKSRYNKRPLSIINYKIGYVGHGYGTMLLSLMFSLKSNYYLAKEAMGMALISPIIHFSNMRGLFREFIDKVNKKTYEMPTTSLGWYDFLNKYGIDYKHIEHPRECIMLEYTTLCTEILKTFYGTDTAISYFPELTSKQVNMLNNTLELDTVKDIFDIFKYISSFNTTEEHRLRALLKPPYTKYTLPPLTNQTLYMHRVYTSSTMADASNLLDYNTYYDYIGSFNPNWFMQNRCKNVNHIEIMFNCTKEVEIMLDSIIKF